MRRVSLKWMCFLRSSLFVLALATASAADLPVHGHRGARTMLPENTLPGFEYAIAQGAEWIELDLWATSDDVLVVTHDPAINLSICRGPDGAERVIRRMTLAQVRQWDCGAPGNPAFPRQKPVPGTRIPTFDEVLALASRSSSFKFNVEIKSDPRKPELQPEPEQYVRLVVDALRGKGLARRALIQSFDWRLLAAARKIAPEFELSALFPTAGVPMDLDFLEVARQAGTRKVSVHHATVTAEKVKRAREAGIAVVAWTANTPEVWEKLLADGVGEIITDDPGGLKQWLKNRP